jgi:hypothetical protein
MCGSGHHCPIHLLGVVMNETQEFLFSQNSPMLTGGLLAVMVTVITSDGDSRFFG